MRINPILTLIALPLIFSCQSSRTSTVNNADSTTTNVLGADRDEHGCIGSAGYTWSQLKQRCIRTFEEGIPLEIYNTAQSYQTNAFVILDSVQKKAEIFVSEEKNSILLDQKNDTLYSNDKFHLSKENFCWTLSLENTKLYQERK